jgi:hypothetical protein
VAKKKAGEQLRLLEGPRRGRDEPSTGGRYAAERTTDPLVTEYLASLQPSECPGCMRPQKTPRGEPLACPRCVKGDSKFRHPSTPMGSGRPAEGT